MNSVRTRLKKAAGAQIRRRRRDIESPYLLSGFARCAVCGGSVGVLDSRQYGCIAYHKRGTTVCGNSLRKPIASLDDPVRQKLRELLQPESVMAIIDGVLEHLAPASLGRDLQRSRQELQTIDREIANLAKAIALGGQLAPLLEELKRRQARREVLTATVAAREAIDVTRFDRRIIAEKVRQHLDAWQSSLMKHGDRARQTLREILVGPLTLTPEGRSYRFEGEALHGALIAGRVGLPTFHEFPWARQLDHSTETSYRSR